jgi:hypothetical protein
MKIISTKNAGAHGIKMLVYGIAGIGKTTLAATAPRPIILSAEAGLLSLRQHDIPAIELKSVQDLTAAHAYLSGPNGADYDTIILDSISEIAEVVLSNAKAQLRDPRAAYGELSEKVTMLIRAFRDMPGKNVVFIAKLVNKEIDSVMQAMPAMPGQSLTQGLSYFFDEVAVMRIGKTENGATYRYLQFQPDYTHVAKDRSGALSAIEEPHLGKLFARISAAAPNQVEQAEVPPRVLEVHDNEPAF